MGRKMDKIFDSASKITGMFVFAAIWAYLVSAEGFFPGTVLGWIPAAVLGVVSCFLAPLLWLVVAAVILLALMGIL